MSHKVKILVLIFFIAISPLVVADNAQVSSGVVSPDHSRIQNSSDVSHLLGWVKDCKEDNICGGHYFESSYITNISNPEMFQDLPVDIKASRPAIFTKSGATVLEGDVVMTQPGREIVADQMTFFRNDKTKKITKSILLGDVNFREHDKLVVAEEGDLDFGNKVYSLSNAIYRMLANTPTGISNVWGRAKNVISKKTGVLKLSKATYTTCPPDAVAWHLWGNNVILDRNAGRGEAYNSVIFLKRVPVFYLPYFSFPIDKERKSGFLFPTLGYSSDSGYNIDAPYYFNLAPNYDLILSPEYFSKRGVLFHSLFRYLSPQSEGGVNLNYIPYDKSFAWFRDRATVTNSSDHRALEALKDNRSYRGLISTHNNLRFSKNWYAALDVNYTTDDYFLQDFKGVVDLFDNDQLLNRADLGYSDDRWNFLARIQAFQTLHPITNNRTKDQYTRLPQLSLSGDFPDSWGGLNYRFDSELVNFMHRDNFYDEGSTPVVSGTRIGIAPSVGMPLNWRGGYFLPKVDLQATVYDTQDKLKKDAPSSVARLHPIFSIDCNTVFSRDVNLFNSGYTQTLEPRLFYLYVPMRNQGDVPIFDTSLPSFDMSQLFRTNRFNGIDRVGDANQIAMALTTRFIDANGDERFNAGLGQIIAIHKHQVSIDRDNSYFVPYNVDPLQNEYLSPLVGRMQGFIDSRTNISLNLAWDPNYNRFNTASANIQYKEAPNKVINVWYNQVLNGDQWKQDETVDLNRIGASLGWKIWGQWNIIGSMNYNISYKRAQNYLYGLEYNSCCWALRLVHSHDLIGIGLDEQKNYDSKYYLQFQLKGLGSVDSGGASGVLSDQVNGYRDNFIAGV